MSSADQMGMAQSPKLVSHNLNQRIFIQYI